MRRLLTDEISGAFYATLFSPGCLEPAKIPWAEDLFNCLILNLLGYDLPQPLAKSVALEVCRANTDYVSTAGPQAEWFHDLIDRTSVEIHRQNRVGQGSPMTTWHDEAHSLEEMAEVMLRLEGTDHRVGLVLCPEEKFESYANALRNALEKEMT